MLSLLDELGVELPVLAAPMAGGASTPALVTAAADAGGLGFLAAGYRTPQALAEQLERVGSRFGVNLFAPNPVPITMRDFHAYAAALAETANRFDVTLPAEAPIEDDDAWHDKLDLLTTTPVPVVSFTFGLPDRSVVATLRRLGTVVLQTVTSAVEARAAVDTGVDAVIVQAAAAGGHSASLTPHRPRPHTPLPSLVAEVTAAVAVPVIGAGGIAEPEDVTVALAAGAQALMVGTALLRTDESGASPTHRAALADPRFTATTVTRAFTGRPARALRNRFIEDYDAIAPSGYPAIHHLTSPLRKAAATADDAQALHLWAGTGFRAACAEPAGRTLRRLAGA